MAVNRYITLANSNSSLSKRFKAIEYKPIFIRGDTIEFTVGGKIDKQAAPVVRGWLYSLRVPIDAPSDLAYGSYEDLMTLFMLSNANAVPSDVITLTDHFADVYSVYFRENAEPTPLTSMLEGASAWMVIQIQLIEAVT